MSVVVFRQKFKLATMLFAKADGTGSKSQVDKVFQAFSGLDLPDQPEDVPDEKWDRIVEWSETIIGKTEPFVRTEAMADWGHIRAIDAVYEYFPGMTPDDILQILKAKNKVVRDTLKGLIKFNTEAKLEVFHKDNAAGLEGLTALRSAIITLQDQLAEEKDKLLADATEKLGCQCLWYGDQVISVHSAEYKPSRRKDGAARPVYLAKYPTDLSFVYGDLSEDTITGRVVKDKHDSVACSLTLGDDTVTAMGSRVSKSPASNAVRTAMRKLYEAKGRPFTQFSRNIPLTILHWEHVEVAAPSIAEEEEGEGGSDTAAH